MDTVSVSHDPEVVAGLCVSQESYLIWMATVSPYLSESLSLLHMKPCRLALLLFYIRHA